MLPIGIQLRLAIPTGEDERGWPRWKPIESCAHGIPQKYKHRPIICSTIVDWQVIVKFVESLGTARVNGIEFLIDLAIGHQRLTRPNIEAPRHLCVREFLSIVNSSSEPEPPGARFKCLLRSF